MPFKINPWLFLLLFFSQSETSSAADAQQTKIAAPQLKEDLQILRTSLEQAHGGIYRYTSKPELDRQFDRAFRRLNQPMTSLEFWRVVGPVVAEIKCGHTSMWWPKDVQTQLVTTTPLIPLNVRVLNGHIYVRRDYSAGGLLLEGAEIVSINGVSAKRILKTMMRVTTGDGNSRTAKPYRLGHYGNFNILLNTALGIESPFRITYRRANAASKTVEIPGLLVPDLGKAANSRDAESDRNADLKILASYKVAVLTIRHWYRYVDAKEKIPLSDFLQESFARLQTNKTETLIIDVRDNDGGLDELGKELFSFLWTEPFQYYSDLVLNDREFQFFKHAPGAKPVPADLVEQRPDGKFRFIKHPNWGIQQPRSPHFAGKIFVLMNGGSFSTTCEFLSILHFHKRATFIGEETGGSYYQNTSGDFNADLILPNSKLQITLRLLTYHSAVARRKHKDRGILPDHPVAYTISDIMAGTDKEMDLALSLAPKH